VCPNRGERKGQGWEGPSAGVRFIFRYDKQVPVTVAGDVFAYVFDSIDAVDAT